MSFREKATFSMVASLERQHGERLSELANHGMRVLPISAIYGGNASGKSVFFKALQFAKRFIIEGRKPDASIPVDPFRLDDKNLQVPTRFEFMILVGDDIYEYHFSVTQKAVTHERLSRFKRNSLTLLYERSNGKIEFGDSSLTEKVPFLEFAFQGTRDNQLFLTNAVSQKVDQFKPVYDWFRDTLQLVSPISSISTAEAFLDEGHPSYDTLNQVLPRFGTGIERIGYENVPFDALPIPELMRNQFKQNLKNERGFRLRAGTANDRYVVTLKDGKICSKKLVAFHRKADGSDIKFELGEESDGSRRLIDLLPAFFQLSSDAALRKVYVIDELDRSLHTKLTRALLESYLLGCGSSNRNQLLFTTHDVQLMDQELFRRDEMWVAEKDKTGSSHLISFGEYKNMRYDKDVRKSYLLGRLGGIPHVSAMSMRKETEGTPNAS